MNINNIGNLYTIAPGTSDSLIKPEKDLTFEESNEAVDQALDSAKETQTGIESTRDTLRQTVVGAVEVQQQQNNVNRYIEAATQEETGYSQSPVLFDATELARTLTINQIANSADNPVRDRIAEKSAQELQSKIEDIIDQRENPELAVNELV